MSAKSRTSRPRKPRARGSNPALAALTLIFTWPSRLLFLRRVGRVRGLRVVSRLLAFVLNTVVLLVELACLGALGPIVTYVVCPAANAFLDLPVSVERCSVWPLRGYVSVTGLRVGNPRSFEAADEYYTETPLVTLRRAVVDIGVMDLLADQVTIERIEAEGLRFLYAVEGDESNLDALLVQAGLKGGSEPEAADAGAAADAPGASPAPEADAESSPEPRLLALRLEDNSVTVRYPLVGMTATLPVPLPPMDRVDEEGQGLFRTLQTTVRGVRQAVSVTVGGISTGSQTVLDAGSAVWDGAGTVGDAALDAGGAVIDGIGSVGGTLVDGVFSLFGPDPKPESEPAEPPAPGADGR